MIDVLNSFHCTNAVQKVINIKKCTKLVIERFGEDIPRSFEELLQLPGVGSKVASCVWNSAHAMCASVAVDTHVHVICNRLGFAASTAAEQTRVQLERWLPVELWADPHAMLVPHGEWVCRKLDPHCHRCGGARYCAYNKKIADFKVIFKEIHNYWTDLSFLFDRMASSWNEVVVK